MNPILKNYSNGRWVESQCDKYLSVTNPATTRRLAKVPAGCTGDVDLAAHFAASSMDSWRNLPHSKRIGYLLKMKQLIEQHAEEIAELCTNESGMTFSESRQELAKALEHLEMACSIPDLFSNKLPETSANSPVEQEIREAIGVSACICPFNYPLMVAFSFFPYAMACGNTCIIKPSEKVPLTITRIFQILEGLHLPPGVLNLVHGGKETINAILAHSAIKAISFVGSSATARQVYQQATLNGKRVQAQGGSNNPMVVLPDADMDATVRIITKNAFGWAGQRIFAASLVILVGEASSLIRPSLLEASQSKECGYGMDPRAEVGPVISNESQKRIKNIIQQGIDEGAEVLLDGRPVTVKGFEDGYFLKPTILGNIKPGGIIHTSEVFGPVLGLIAVESIDEAIRILNATTYGNAASIFTQNEAAARKFSREVKAGNIGINSAAPAPMAYFPIYGWRESIFENQSQVTLYAIDFFTRKKRVVQNWQMETIQA